MVMVLLGMINNDDMDGDDNHDKYDDDDETCQRDSGLDQQEEQQSLWLQVVWVGLAVWNLVVWVGLVVWNLVVWVGLAVWNLVVCHLQGETPLQVICNVISVNVAL